MVLTIAGIPLLLIYLAVVGGVLAKLFRKMYKRFCCCPGAARRRRPGRDDSVNSTSISASFEMDKHDSYLKTDPDNLYVQQRTCESCRCSKNDKRRDMYVYDTSNDANNVAVPALVLVAVVIVYIVLGGLVFASYHDWSFMDSLFFSFAVIGTIGLVDFPRHKDQSEREDFAKPLALTSNTGNTVGGLFVILCTGYLLIGLAILSMCVQLLEGHWRGFYVRIAGKLGVKEQSRQQRWTTTSPSASWQHPSSKEASVDNFPVTETSSKQKFQWSLWRHHYKVRRQRSQLTAQQGHRELKACQLLCLQDLLEEKLFDQWVWRAQQRQC